jgi:hypothetical protein
VKSVPFGFRGTRPHEDGITDYMFIDAHDDQWPLEIRVEALMGTFRRMGISLLYQGKIDEETYEKKFRTPANDDAFRTKYFEDFMKPSA